MVVAMAARYKGYRYPIEVIGHAVWLYHRFALSLRDVEELMLARGVVVSYETIRSGCAKFGPDYAARLRRRRPRPGDGIVKLFGKCLWRSRCECTAWRKMVADCVFQAAAAVMIWFQTAKRLVISVRHSGALIR